MYLPGEDEPGIYTDGTGNVVQMSCRYTEAYINKNIKKTEKTVRVVFLMLCVQSQSPKPSQ